MRTSVRLFKRACSSSISRLNGALCCVDVAIDYLEVWQTPVGEQRRPRNGSVVLPYSKQRHTVIYFGVPPQPSTCLAAAPPLKATQERCLVIRCAPKLPGDDTSTMPRRILVWSGVPQILVPAESIDGLTADAAKALTQVVGSLSERSRRRSECCRQSSFATLTDPPCPPSWSSGPGS